MINISLINPTHLSLELKLREEKQNIAQSYFTKISLRKFQCNWPYIFGHFLKRSKTFYFAP